jgi:hypothetical protein
MPTTTEVWPTSLFSMYPPSQCRKRRIYEDDDLGSGAGPIIKRMATEEGLRSSLSQLRLNEPQSESLTVSNPFDLQSGLTQMQECVDLGSYSAKSSDDGYNPFDACVVEEISSLSSMRHGLPCWTSPTKLRRNHQYQEINRMESVPLSRVLEEEQEIELPTDDTIPISSSGAVVRYIPPVHQFGSLWDVNMMPNCKLPDFPIVTPPYPNYHSLRIPIQRLLPPPETDGPRIEELDDLEASKVASAISVPQITCISSDEDSSESESNPWPGQWDVPMHPPHLVDLEVDDAMELD